MRNERVVAQVTFLKQRKSDCWVPQGTLKRKFGALLPFTSQEELCYPSTPMSSPRSPPRQPLEHPHSATNEPGTSGTAHTGPGVSIVPDLPVPAPTSQFVRPPPPSGYLPYPPPLPVQPAGSAATPLSIPGVLQSGSTTTSGPALTAGPSVAGPSSTRTGRKSKAHVASACINCKRAHLSCDVQRPCARCVASGKQVTLIYR